MREWVILGHLALLAAMCSAGVEARGAEQKLGEAPGAEGSHGEEAKDEPLLQDTPAPPEEQLPLLQAGPPHPPPREVEREGKMEEREGKEGKKGGKEEGRKGKEEKEDGEAEEGEEEGDEEDEEGAGGGGIVLVALGGGEDEVAMAQMAALLSLNGHRVSAIVYGPGPREERFPAGVKVLELGVSEDDPLYPGGSSVAVAPGEEEGAEWVSGRVLASRARACGLFSRLAWVEAVFRRARLVVTPLFLHDLCVLTLAQRVGVPVVGVVTSRVGAWWVWDNLGVLPPLATTPVPPATMQELDIWARASNIARHYGYVSSLRQQWQVPALTALDASWSPAPTIDALYASLARVLVAWDPLLDAHLPHTPIVLPVGGFHYSTGRMTKDVLVPALLNRAGVLVVSAGGREAWLGPDALAALHSALRPTSYTVLWRVSHPHLQPNVTLEEMNSASAKFVYKEYLPLSDVLSHPRPRLLVSTCGDAEAKGGCHFGFPRLLPSPFPRIKKIAWTPPKKILGGLGISGVKVIGMLTIPTNGTFVITGIAEVVPASRATVPALKEALSKLAGDRSYRERGRRIAEDLHDSSLSPSDRLLFALERVLRRPNSLRYRPPASTLYLLQQSNADVYLLLLILLTTLLGVLIAAGIVALPILLKKQKAKAD
ncbi:UDP-glucuronosyltransferase 3A1-like [Penaeus monodon]|uniref:UDP-glucuronosyltransferase 3A1-like n=1 Tax=Penaeus monodon TaxID=6687 RepID=UPI0018A6DA18|nr:UDP-glucuronosyltransferase 3A1-like [Penaeus monodon]